jgi:putative ribosome biogenesis GTPase RsgA
LICQSKKGDISALSERLDGETVAFVGQSGVGKSSLINAIKAPFLPKLIKRVEVVVCCPSAEFSEITLVFCSALSERLDGETVAFVGQSGVGKSSLINVLIPDAEHSRRIN